MDTIVQDGWVIGGRKLKSRFFLGTGRFPSPAVFLQALEASGAEVITFAVRRINLDNHEDDGVLQHLPDDGQALLDLGCGLGLFAHVLRQRGGGQPYLGVDVDAGKITRAMCG